MIIYYDKRFETVNFGIEILKKSLAKRNIFSVERELEDFCGKSGEKMIVASFSERKICKNSESLEDGGFEIKLDGNAIFVTGKEYTGIMYGLLDMAETIHFFGLEAIQNKCENPFLKLRGIKFNLPFEPYDLGDPMEKNVETCMDTGFWREYIDFLAMNRYNCLSLWSEHPFHMMFRLEKYPLTCPYPDKELERYKQLFKFIFSHAKKRGIEVYLITWNIRITGFVAKGLGLPEELGDMFDRYDYLYDRANKIPNNICEFDAIRQHLDIIKDYFKECIRTLVTTYRDLKGLGTNCAEEMVGSVEERQNWVIETYLDAIKESGRDLPFIMRTNAGNGKTAKQFMDIYPGKEKYISWKYSNAHMYSHPQPQFEQLWEAWDGVDMEEVKVLYTVRNDDIHTLRWGDHEYIAGYLKGMKKPYTQGFYWGADGYLWGKDFQHIPHGHKMWKYDFEKHWYQFELLGRLGYKPDLGKEIWGEKFKQHYGELWGEKFFAALMHASRIIPAVNRLFWLNYDGQWHPESLLSVRGFKTVIDFVNGTPMPGVGTIGIRQYTENAANHAEYTGETPDDVINTIRQSAACVDKMVKELRSEIPKEYLAGEIVCTLLDLEAWGELGRYYFNKFSAALELACFDIDGEEMHKLKAVKYLEEGLEAWKELSGIWASHYMPYKMVRSKRVFGWPYYTSYVENDIALARNY